MLVTRPQRQTLKQHANNGRHAYDYNCKLRFKEQNQGTKIKSRLYRKAPISGHGCDFFLSAPPPLTDSIFFHMSCFLFSTFRHFLQIFIHICGYIYIVLYTYEVVNTKRYIIVRLELSKKVFDI